MIPENLDLHAETMLLCKKENLFNMLIRLKRNLRKSVVSTVRQAALSVDTGGKQSHDDCEPAAVVPFSMATSIFGS